MLSWKWALVLFFAFVAVAGLVWSFSLAGKTKSRLMEIGKRRARELMGKVRVVRVSKDPLNTIAPVYLTVVRNGYMNKRKNWIPLQFPYGHKSYDDAFTFKPEDKLALHYSASAGANVSGFHLPLDRAERYLEVVADW